MCESNVQKIDENYYHTYCDVGADLVRHEMQTENYLTSQANFSLSLPSL